MTDDHVVQPVKLGVISDGRPCGRRHRIEFHDSIEFPTKWDTLEELVNLDDELLENY